MIQCLYKKQTRCFILHLDVYSFKVVVNHSILVTFYGKISKEVESIDDLEHVLKRLTEPLLLKYIKKIKTFTLIQVVEKMELIGDEMEIYDLSIHPFSIGSIQLHALAFLTQLIDDLNESDLGNDYRYKTKAYEYMYRLMSGDLETAHDFLYHAKITDIQIQLPFGIINFDYSDTINLLLLCLDNLEKWLKETISMDELSEIEDSVMTDVTVNYLYDLYI